MYEIPVPQELHRTGELLQEMPDNHFVQPPNRRYWVLPDHIFQSRVVAQFVSLLDEVRQISKLAVFHHEMYMGRRFSAIDESDDMGMVEAFEDLDFAVEVVLELLIEFRQIDRFDSYKSSGGL